MSLLLTRGTVYAPTPLGVQDILVVGEKILRIGELPRAAIDILFTGTTELINASDCFVIPGLIDPHEHIDGGSGESGYQTRTPAIAAAELVEAGITTAVGTLGTDVTTKTMASLLARARGLQEQGLNVFLWTGGYTIPPSTLTGTVRQDMLFIPEVIGAGEVALSDHRSSAPTLHELARLVAECHVGGILTRKAGVTHFHIGEAPSRLGPLRALLETDEWAIQPQWLYPTHVERNKELVHDAASFTKLGGYVDMDMMEEDALKWLPVFLNAGGELSRLTLSSDAAVTPPRFVFEQVILTVKEHRLPLDKALCLVTTNTASVLHLATKGRLREGYDADILVIDKATYALRYCISRGNVLMRDGAIVDSAWGVENIRKKTGHGGHGAGRQSPGTGGQ